MSTVEKLFVQIFERKNSIIQRVKQQTDLYTQHLVSKALADGITPPSWLWNPSQSSDVQKVLNKEELISEILLPHPQPEVQFPSAHCSKYNKQVVPRDNAELLVGLSKEINSYNTGDIRDRETVAASGHDKNTRCTGNCVPEQDNSVNSPEDETEARISNIYSAPEQSLVRIQRSRSRQKALELRYSGGPKAKSRSIQKNVSLDCSARNGQTIFASEKVDNVSDLQEMVEPSVIRHGTFGVGELNKAENTNKEETIPYSTIESARLKGSGRASSGVDSLRLGSCSGSIQRDDSAPVQYEEEFSKCVDGGTEFPEVTAYSFGEARAENFCVHMEKYAGMHDDSISQPSSYQQRCRQNEGPEVDMSIRSAKEDSGILVQFMQQFDNSNVSEEITKPSECIDLERTRSTSNDEVLPIGPYMSVVPCHTDKVYYSRCKQTSLKTNELQRMSSDEAIIVCADPWNNISHQLTNTDAVDANELISHNFVKAPPVNSWPIVDHARSELLVSINPSDCLTFLSPKQLLFDDSEECNLDKRFSLNLENRMTQKPSSSSRPGRSTEANEFCKDSLESTSEENMQLVEHSFSTHEHPIQGTSYGDSVILPLAQNPNVESQPIMTHTKDCEGSDLKDQVPRKCKEVCKSTPVVETVKGQFGTGDKSKGTSASNASKRKYLMLDHDKWENDSISCGLTEFPLLNYQNHDLSKSEEIKFGKKSQPRKMRSWPRTKRRKIEDHESNSCSARVNFFNPIDLANRDLGKAGVDMENFVDHTSLMNESTNEEMRQKVATESNEEMKPLREPLKSEIVLCSGGLSEPLGSSSSDLLQVTVPILSSLGKEAARVSQDWLVKELDMHADLQKGNDEKDRVEDNSADADRLTCTERTTSERKLHLAEDGQLSQYLERYKRGLELNSINQSLPELEGFILDSQSENEELGVSGSQGNVHEFVPPRTSLERVSILERICKSASQQALSTEFSSFKLHGFHMPYRSVPNGLLECMDLSRISASNEDSIEAARSNDTDGPYAGLQLGCTFSPYTSPVGKQWDKTSLRSGSSGKTLSSNPELVCFPIEEDPSVSEENENIAEESDKSQDDILSSINVSLEQEPFADMTEAHLNTSSLVAASDKFLSKGSGNSDTNDARLNNTHREVKRNVGHPARDKSLDKENDILSLLGNGNEMSKPSLNSRFSKANSSCNTSSRKERKKLSEKESKRNNIVSNVTSFIPLVQQKQAAAQCTGKKEIKVKALEAAVAAKRLEEKKANERKMRKEALRIEKARLEQENLRQLKLEKKRKEEERKKRDADIAAKKRQREEEDKKEKERKKKRLEEARQQQREDGKLRLEKSKQLSVIGESDNRNKEANYESKKTQILLKETRNNVPSENPYAKLRPNGSTNHIQDSDISIEACRSSTDSSDQRKTISPFNYSPNTDTMAAKKMQEKSYEISPYQCSDDEEEEEEEVPNKKFIPSWTSKSSVALLLPLQQGIDPDTIFPPDSFCSTEEVLLPRKPQHKQLAT